jgi:hypothetical protein
MQCRRLLLACVVSLTVLSSGANSLFAQHRHHDSHIPGTSGLYKPNWGVSVGSPRSGISGAVGHGSYIPGYSYRSGYSSYGFPGFGYSHFGYSGYGYTGFGGFSYYAGPVGFYGDPYGPYGYPAYGYPNYGPVYSYIPAAPVVMQAHPLWLGQNPFDNAAIREWMPDAEKPAGGANPAPAAQPPQENPPIIINPSTPEAKRNSIRFQAQGDEWFQKHNFVQAYARYKQAANAASDLAEPRLRMAIALAAMNEFGQAAGEFKRAVRINPTAHLTADRLDAIYGEGGAIAKNSMLHKLQNWVREDIRDPDRLFVIGALLYLDDNVDQSTPFLQAAAKLAGSPPHVQAFLRPVAQAAALGEPQRIVPAGQPQPRAPAIDRQGAPAVPIRPKAPPPAADGPQLLPPGEPIGPSQE